ncbi:putative Protein TMED8 [Hypsibius exemplaris]|uniref:Golgi resident protein GCP60 n=1 Tax=Hypsibius exemplaris TaxID=2072580 RepID=A0A1W0WIN4_HYPEX|nr:putative Protein TMED8 [Hypsibius exemplaris]
MELPPGFTAASTSAAVTHSESSSKLATPSPTIGEATNFTFQEKWGLPVEVVYRLGLGFYREKDGKAPLHISYTDKVKLVAYTRQISHGPYEQGRVPDVGVFNVIGNDRRQAWSSLGTMSKEDAMIRFVDLLDVLCPLFKPYIEAHKRDREDRERRERGDDEGSQKADDEAQTTLSENGFSPQHLLPEQERQIRDALNQQTLHQFRAFCEQQLPGKAEEQKALIERLQEEHFLQYMRHWMEYQANGEKSQLGNGGVDHVVDENAPGHPNGDDANEEEVDEETVTGSGVGSKIVAAAVWTRKDIKEFKESVRKEGTEGILKIGQGETITIRVPTHPEGNYLFWEFATDSYDIGFGLWFEWSNNGTDSRVTIHISESDEEDEDFEGGAGGAEGANDPEKGAAGAGRDKPAGPPIDEVIPVYRRNCHEEVIAGSHLYPARQGVYLLKFDNSFSLWRSKTLYYRVYYTR